MVDETTSHHTRYADDHSSANDAWFEPDLLRRSPFHTKSLEDASAPVGNFDLLRLGVVAYVAGCAIAVVFYVRAADPGDPLRILWMGFSFALCVVIFALVLRNVAGTRQRRTVWLMVVCAGSLFALSFAYIITRPSDRNLEDLSLALWISFFVSWMVPAAAYIAGSTAVRLLHLKDGFLKAAGRSVRQRHDEFDNGEMR